MLKKLRELILEIRNMPTQEEILFKLNYPEKSYVITSCVRRMRCRDCGLSEERDIKVGSSLKGVKCPSCEGQMIEAEEEDV